MTHPSSYKQLKQTWVKQQKYTLETIKENFGSFSISAAVRPSNRVTPYKHVDGVS